MRRQPKVEARYAIFLKLSGNTGGQIKENRRNMENTKIKANPHLTVIGHITDEKEGVHLISRAGSKIPLIARGWNALKSKD